MGTGAPRQSRPGEQIVRVCFFMTCDPRHIPALVRRVSEQHGPDVAVSPESPVGQLLLELDRVAATRAPIIFWGEPGVGRTTLAHAVHALGEVHPHPFVRIRCAFQGEAELMSALFGRDRDPTRGRLGAGALHEARGGTLLLESIEDLPAKAQLWLCDVLESIAEQPAGHGGPLPRIVATSTTDPARSVEDGDLREELYYLLGVFVAAIPPLRNRRTDIPVLAEHFLERANTRLRLRATGFTERTITELVRAPWLGNASELRNVVEHAALVAGEGLVGVNCLPSVNRTAGLSPSSPKVVVPVGTSAADAERKLILATLEHTGFNKAEAARTLDLDVKTVRAKLRAYGI